MPNNGISESALDNVKTVYEAIVVADLVDPTKTATRHRWHTIGKDMMRSLRECIFRVGSSYGLSFQKYTGDGYLITLYNDDANEKAVVQALQMMIDICCEINMRNDLSPTHHQMKLCFALHYGEVDIIGGDREGPDVSYTFGLKRVNSFSLKQAYNPMPLDLFPTDNYVTVSEEVINIIKEYQVVNSWESIGLLPLKGFQGWHQLFMLRNLSERVGGEVNQRKNIGVFDVFLCHKSTDKPAVRDIGERLKERGISPWLDEWELRPGQSWLRSLEQQIGGIKSVAIFIGSDGLGPFQQEEVDAVLRRFAAQNSPVIPVLLNNAPDTPELPIFLEGRMWVDFRIDTPDPIEQLIWGITGER